MAIVTGWRAVPLAPLAPLAHLPLVALVALVALLVRTPPARAEDPPPRSEPPARPIAERTFDAGLRPRRGCACLPDPVLRDGRPPRCGDVYAAAGMTLLPNVGGVLEVGRVVRTTPGLTTSIEAQLGAQLLDDKAFIDNGDPVAGDWWQAGLGFKWATAPAARRHLTGRAGAFWFRAEGEPNWVDVPGDWLGGYLAFGFETDLTPEFSFGPALTVMVGTSLENPHLELVPQLTWRLTWWTGASAGAHGAHRTCLPRGELYAGANLALAPGLGGGPIAGQVFARRPESTWSFELAASFQGLHAGTLLAEGDGDAAQLLGGVKAAFRPHGRWHPVARMGATWLRTTSEVAGLGGPGDRLGAYVGIGFELDLGSRLSTGPELALCVLTQEGDDVALQVLPRLAWNLLWKL